MTTERVLTLSEVLERYANGARDFKDMELNGPAPRLKEICLDGADFSGSFIVTSFKKASLRGARFVDANVKTCDFRDADLCGADFTGASLCGTQFSGARMDGARFSGASNHGIMLQDGDIPDW